VSRIFDGYRKQGVIHPEATDEQCWEQMAASFINSGPQQRAEVLNSFDKYFDDPDFKGRTREDGEIFGQYQTLLRVHQRMMRSGR
jgi:hypothetical protein